jgi:hypothetical protein
MKIFAHKNSNEIPRKKKAPVPRKKESSNEIFARKNYK